MRTDTHHTAKFEMIKISTCRSYFEKLLKENRNEFKYLDVFKHQNVGFQITSADVEKALSEEKKWYITRTWWSKP